MKNRGFLFIILIAVLLICPLAATGGAKAPDKNGNEVTKTNTQDDENSILVLSSSTKKINEIDMFEYVVGAVAAEMPPTYHSQALRAQAAVCYTYAVKKRSSPDPALGGADITDDSAVHQGYLEMSNVQVADEMVNMIVAQRAYEMNSKAIQASDEMLQQANNLRS